MITLSLIVIVILSLLITFIFLYFQFLDDNYVYAFPPSNAPSDKSESELPTRNKHSELSMTEIGDDKWCGQVITQNVILTSNLNCVESDGLIVGASGIIVDLNGHTIYGPDVDSDTKSSSKVGIMIPNMDNLRVQNGILKDFKLAY